MNFKGLPSYEEITSFYDSVYDSERVKLAAVFLYHKHRSSRFKYALSTHSSLIGAYSFLLNHRKFEVYDDFFGKGFPFIFGRHISHSSSAGIPSGYGKFGATYSNHGIIITGLSIVNPEKYTTFLPYCDHFLHGEVSKDSFLYNTCYGRKYLIHNSRGRGFVPGYSYFESSTYDELVKRLSVITIMDM